MTSAQADLEIDLDLPFDSLVSYHYFRGDEQMAQLTGHGNLRLIADSGAFSAFTQGEAIKLDEYASWLRKWHPYLYWAASLDVFGDPQATLSNFRRLRDDHGLDTVPTLHIGADPAHLDAYAAEGVDFVALGGMVGMPKPNVLRWLVHVLRYARDHHPQMRFHAWGMSTQRFLEKLPLYSVDSSGLLTQAYRYGTLSLWDPRKRRMTTISLNGRDPRAHRRLLLDDYRVPPHVIGTSHQGNRHLLVRLAARSAQLRAAHLQQRHNVPAPHWAINPSHPARDDTPAPAGTRLHVVDGHQNNTQLRRIAAPPGTRTHIVSNITDFKRVCTPLAEGDPLK